MLSFDCHCMASLLKDALITAPDYFSVELPKKFNVFVPIPPKNDEKYVIAPKKRLKKSNIVGYLKNEINAPPLTTKFLGNGPPPLLS